MEPNEETTSEETTSEDVPQKDSEVTPNFFRTKYRVISDAEKKQMYLIKEAADKLLALFPKIEDKETSIAITKLEESVMWVVKGITK